jgi:hypothetical protein
MTMSATVQELRENVEKLKSLETELEFFSEWQTPQDSPRGVVESSATLIQRYQTAKEYYLQRRLEGLVVNHMGSFGENKPRHFDFPEVSDDSGLQNTHDQALASLQTTVEGIQTQVSELRDTYQTVSSKREELEQMIQDLIQQDETNGMDLDRTNDREEGETPVAELDMAVEQERIEELQRTKRRLKEKLANIKREKEEIQERVRGNQNDIALLQEQTRRDDPEELEKKVRELREMKVFYDSLREVLEEIGGVKILEVKEDEKSHHLHLIISLYETYKVEIELKMHRKISLKLVNAKWISKPVVQAQVEEIEEERDTFSLPMASIDDLVQVATTNLAPPHDVRFIIRESLARIRIQKDRVNDLAVLRRHVLTKIVGGDQIVCSLNDGIVIVMRLYDNLVRAEQIVGVSGWDQETTDKILASLPQDNTATPTSIIQQVQMRIQKLKEGGMNPRTPTMPARRRDVDMK